MTSSCDELAITYLASSYTSLINMRKPAEAAATYLPDGVFAGFGNEIVGRADLEAAFAATLERLDLLFQISQAGIVRVNGDTAKARWNLTEFTRERTTGRSGLFLGAYEDDVVRTPNGWRFARRTLFDYYRGPVDLSGTARPIRSGDFPFMIGE